MVRWWTTSALALTLLAAAAQATPEPRRALAARVCDAAESQAKANGLDPSFFVRLLWRESLFDPDVVSPQRRARDRPIHAGNSSQARPGRPV